jgi:hypothetical protein
MKPFLHPITQGTMNRVFPPLIVASILTACTTAPIPPLSPDNPGNPSAPVTIQQPFRNPLAADGLTKKTAQIFAQTIKPEEQASPTPQRQQTGQMPGMNM